MKVLIVGAGVIGTVYGGSLGVAGDTVSVLQHAHLLSRDFAVERIHDMEGWLAYHAVFVACICSALDRTGTDTQRLAGDRAMVRLLCHALTEGFAALRRRGVGGLPGN